jgi:prepilin-type N-terminal cleavage/methylation domain-containing protein
VPTKIIFVSSKKAFTLIEILIVISVLSIVFVSFASMPSFVSKKDKLAWSVENLPKKMRSFLAKDTTIKQVSLICTEMNSTCRVVADGKVLFPSIQTDFINDSNKYDIRALEPSPLGLPQAISFGFEKRIRESYKRTLVYSCYQNGSCSSFVLYDGAKYHILRALDENVTSTESKDEAALLFIRMQEVPNNLDKIFTNE